MDLDNVVVFKGNKNGISIIIDEKSEFDDIKKVMVRKIKQSKKFFGEAETVISFAGKELSDTQQNELIDVIKKESDLSILFVGDIKKLKTLEQIEVKPVDIGDKHVKNKRLFNKPKTHQEIADENRTYYHHGSVRSGQLLSYHGSIIVIGDVNSGGEVKAEGNIIVLGTLKGLCHAGCSGNDNCFVSALKFSPVQVRISTVIVSMPELSKDKKGLKDKPLYAYIENKEMFIKPLT